MSEIKATLDSALETVEEITAEVIQPKDQPQEATPVEKEPAPKPEEEKKKIKFTLTSPLAILLILGIVAISALGIVTAFQNYRAMRGIADSDFVGLANFQKALALPSLPQLLRNTVLLRLIQLIAGLLLALLLVLWVKASKKPGTALTKACLCLVPMCLPAIFTSQLVLQFLPREYYMSASFYPLVFALASILQTAGFFGFCGGLFQYLGRRGIGGGAMQGLLIGLLISSLSLLTPDFSAIFTTASPVTYSAADTLDYYVYRTGLQNMQISLANAVTTLKVVAQGILALLPACLLARLAKKDETRIELPDAKGSRFIFSAAQLIWIGLLAAVLVLAIGINVISYNPEAVVQAAGGILQQQQVIRSLIMSLVTSLLTGIIAGFVAYSFISYVRNGRKGFALMLIILGSAQSFLIAEYLAARYMGIVNTPFAVILRQLCDPKLLSLMIVMAVALRMAPERNTKGLVLGLMLLGAAFAWGEFISSLVFVNQSSLFPVSLLFYRMRMTGNAVGDASVLTEAQLLAQQASIPIMGLLTTLPAVLLGFGGARCCIRAFRDAK